MAMCLRHGIPSMAIPFGFDQLLWGTRIAELGLGPLPMDPEKIDVTTLSEALVRMAEDGEMKAKARSMADKLRKEDGVANAVRVMEKALGVSRVAHAS